MDINRLRLGEMIAAVSAILLFIVMFFHWYGIKTGCRRREAPSSRASRASRSAAPSGFPRGRSTATRTCYLFLLIIVAVGLVVLSATERTAAVPISASVIVTAMGALWR